MPQKPWSQAIGLEADRTGASADTAETLVLFAHNNSGGSGA